MKLLIVKLVSTLLQVKLVMQPTLEGATRMILVFSGAVHTASKHFLRKECFSIMWMLSILSFHWMLINLLDALFSIVRSDSGMRNLPSNILHFMKKVTYCKKKCSFFIRALCGDQYQKYVSNWCPLVKGGMFFSEI